MKEVPIKEITELLRNGKSIKQSNQSKGLPITRIETISNGFIDLTKVGFANLTIEENKEWLLKKGDILISHINSKKHLGKCAIYEGNPQNIIHGMNLLNLRCKTDKANSRYIYYILNSPQFKLQLPKITKNSVNQSSFSITSFKELKIPLPPIEEQKRIADILDRADAIRQKRKRAIELTEQLARSTFLDMFGDPFTNPKGWEVQKLSDLCTKITDGTHKTPNYLDIGIPFLSAKNIKENKIDWENIKFISKEEHNQLIRRCNPEKGDVLLTKSGTIGECTLIDEDVEFSLFESVALLKIDKKEDSIVPNFLVSLLNNRGTRLNYTKNIKGVAVKHLHLVDIKNLPIIIPPKYLQDSFLRVSNRLESYRKKMDSYYSVKDNLFNSLLQRAFKGEL